MAINRHVLLPRSSKQGSKPTVDSIAYGELTVNYNANHEFLATKNSNGDIITFSSDNSQDGLWKKGTGESAVKLDSGATASGKLSVAEGLSTSASGFYSHAEGYSTTASGACSHAEGQYTNASGSCSHAEGNQTHANGYYSHAEGVSTTASSSSSHAEGNSTTASGNISHAEGYRTTASGIYSHAEGQNTTASGDSSHAEGEGTTANGTCSHAEGNSTTASGYYSHAEGVSTTASGSCSHAEGEGTTASGYYSHAEGFYNTASGNFSHAEGYGTIASGAYSHAEGTSGIAYGNAGHVEGIHTQALNIVNDVNSGDTHITVLFYTDSFNFNLDYYKNCYICGPNQWKARITGASYDTSATIPDGAKAIRFELEDALPIDAKQADEKKENQHGTHFYTWKYSITNIGTTRDYAQHAEGEYTMCIGDVSHAEGKTSMAVGKVSHAEGQCSISYGDYSHTEGNHTIAMNEGEHACGSYNRSASGSGQVFSVGVGTSNDNRVNSFYVKNDGTIGSDLDMSISGNSKITLSTASDKLIMSAGTLTTNCTMTTGAYFTTSDERLKTNIIDVTEDEIEKAKKVDLKSFNLKRDGKKHFGVVAQEVEAAGLAELVNTDSEGMKSVDYTSLLILKIAELEKEIKDLKNQINNK